MRADDIVSQRFTKVFRGYDVQEVDLFLDDVICAMDELEEERRVSAARMDALLKELERCDAKLKALEANSAQKELKTPEPEPPSAEEKSEQPAKAPL